jgi:hypothetical protein
MLDLFGADTAPTKPPTPTKQTFGESVETWQPLAEAYHAYHFNCAICIASGKGYGLRCGVGSSLWRVYSDAPVGPAPGFEPRHKGDRHE